MKKNIKIILRGGGGGGGAGRGGGLASDNEAQINKEKQRGVAQLG